MIGLGIAHQFRRSFGNKKFRYLWFSDSMIGWGENMEFVVLAWFVLGNTDSPFLVGLYASLRFTGTLFAPLYGVVVDRYPRDRLLVFSRSGFGLVATLILVLSFTGTLQVWQAFVLVGITGMGRAFDNVASQSLVADLVEPVSLRNAVGLTRTVRDAAQIVGPIVGGVMLERLGMAQAYVLVVSMYVSGAVLATRIRSPLRVATAQVGHILAGITETFKYVVREKVVLAILLLAVVVNLTGFPLNLGLMPVFARDELGLDAEGLGVLLSAYAAGAFAGSLVMASSPRFLRLGRIMVMGSLAWHAGVIIVSQMQWFPVSVGVLVVTGVAQSFTMVTMAVLLLGVTASEVRGRVMGLRSLAVYALPVGLLSLGAAADVFDVRVALLVGGTIGIALTLAIVARFPAMWRAG